MPGYLIHFSRHQTELRRAHQFLIDFPMKEMVQCSRRLTQVEIEQKKAQCLMEAERGTVFVSAGISEGEKQICKALREV